MSDATQQPIDPSARWKALAVLAIVAVVAIGVVVENTMLPGGTKLTVAPDVVFKARDGKDVHLSDYRGKIVLMNFWATWCPPCVEETPSFDRLARKLKESDPDIVILAASVDENGWDAIDPFLKRYHASSLPVVLDDGAKMASAFQTYKLPETWVVSRDGHKLKRYIGATNWDDPRILDEIRRLDHDAGAPAS